MPDDMWTDTDDMELGKYKDIHDQYGDEVGALVEGMASLAAGTMNIKKLCSNMRDNVPGLSWLADKAENDFVNLTMGELSILCIPSNKYPLITTVDADRK